MLVETEKIVDLPSIFPKMFPEISRDGYCGDIYEKTQDEIITSMLALLWMAANEYETFVEVQADERKLSSRRWQEIQSIMKWAGLDTKELHACLVLLAIRGLGNRRAFVRECPRNCRSPSARAVIHMIDNKAAFVPSVGELSRDTRKLLQVVLESLASFDILQFVHGEAPISALAALHKCFKKHPRAERLYVVLVLSIASGRGSQVNDHGCGFDEEIAKPILAAVQAVRQRHMSAENVYLLYLTDRARELRLACSSPEERALVRLCLLGREAREICSAWKELSRTDRLILTEGLMSPLPVALCGVPEYLAAVEKNQAMAMGSALVILSDVFAKLRTHVPAKGATRSLDMSDLIKFAAEVSILATFEVGVETAKVEITSTRVVFTMLPKFWQRVKEGIDLSDDAHVRTRSLRRLLAKQEILEQNQNVMRANQNALLERNRGERSPAPAPVLPQSTTAATTTTSTSPHALASGVVACAA
jgi:hypothetical protein